MRQVVRPRRELRVLRNDAKLLLVGKDRLAKFVPTVVEQVHVADLLDPFWRGVVRRMCAAGHVIHKEGFVGRDLA